MQVISAEREREREAGGEDGAHCPVCHVFDARVGSSFCLGT